MIIRIHDPEDDKDILFDTKNIESIIRKSDYISIKFTAGNDDILRVYGETGKEICLAYFYNDQSSAPKHYEGKWH